MKYFIKEIEDSKFILDKTTSLSVATLQKVYHKEIRVFGIQDKGANIVAHFFIYFFNKLWQKHLITPPFLTDIQLATFCPSNNPSQVNNFNRDILSTIAEFLHQFPHTYLEIVLPVGVVDGLPFKWLNYKCGIRYTYYLDLTISEDLLLQNMSTQRRKNINDANKLELEVRNITDSNLIKEKAIELLTTKKAKFNRDIVTGFSNIAGTDNLKSIGIYEGDKLLALSTCFISNNESTYLFGWNSPDDDRSFLGTYALWKGILASRNNANRFNFAGSQIPSIEKYFRGFGGQLTPLISVISDKRKLTKQFT